MKYFTKTALSVRPTTHLGDVLTRKRPWLQTHADEFQGFLQNIGVGPRNGRADQFIDNVPSLQSWRQQAKGHEAKYLTNINKVGRKKAREILDNSTSAVYNHPTQRVLDPNTGKQEGVRHILTFRRSTRDIEAGVHGNRQLAYVSVQPNSPSYASTNSKNRKRAPQINRYLDELNR
jgi:hypothetical protein